MNQEEINRLLDALDNIANELKEMNKGIIIIIRE
jgi:hypothetical protein